MLPQTLLLRTALTRPDNHNYTYDMTPPGFKPGGGGGGGAPYNGLYGEDPPERGTFFTPQVYERVVISGVEVFERVG